MESKFWNIVNWSILGIVTLIAVWIAWGFSQGGEMGNYEAFAYSDDCVDVAGIDEFRYEACYDAYSETIFLKASRGKVGYVVDKLDISFVDLSSQFYELEDVPGLEEEKAYKISANKNPGAISVKLSVVGDAAEPVCEASRVSVDYCPVGIAGEGMGISISPIDGINIKDFIEIEDFVDVYSDVIVMDLAEKERIWESTCKSDWDCGAWEDCEEGVQHRDCDDLENCPIPTDSPLTAQGCDGACIENWECEWSSCEEGYSVPSCNDLNDCGTSYAIPKKLLCEDSGKCVPDVVCSEWSSCDVDYDFSDLVGSFRVIELEGSKSRVCVDSEGCVATLKEKEICSVSIDIYTERFERCGEEYVGVYNLLDDNTLAILKESTGDRSYLNIYFDDQDGVYCDYCFDGSMDGDEEGVDCGGSCKACQGPYVPEVHWWD